MDHVILVWCIDRIVSWNRYRLKETDTKSGCAPSSQYLQGAQWYLLLLQEGWFLSWQPAFTSCGSLHTQHRLISGVFMTTSRLYQSRDPSHIYPVCCLKSRDIKPHAIATTCASHITFLQRVHGVDATAGQSSDVSELTRHLYLSYAALKGSRHTQEI